MCHSHFNVKSQKIIICQFGRDIFPSYSLFQLHNLKCDTLFLFNLKGKLFMEYLVKYLPLEPHHTDVCKQRKEHTCEMHGKSFQ
jgi:hypothetical protein